MSPSSSATITLYDFEIFCEDFVMELEVGIKKSKSNLSSGMLK